MGELVTLATQVGIFFLFTPACLIARYGGRAIDLRRANAERRAIMRIRLNFGSGGALGASCSTETASGQQEACFGQQQGSGRWSLTGSTLCVAAAVTVWS